VLSVHELRQHQRVFLGTNRLSRPRALICTANGHVTDNELNLKMQREFEIEQIRHPIELARL